MSTITCTGAAGEVTGSGHLLITPNGRVLLDCGLFQGHHQETDAKNRSFSYEPRELNHVIVSHAHLDHVGRLPLLIKGGFRGRIVSTRATRELAELILLDSAKIQVQDAEYAGRHGLTDPTLVTPLYTPEDIPQVMSHFDDLPYERMKPGGLVYPGELTVRLFDAGHILGSAAIHLSWPEAGQLKGLAYTGDLGRKNTPLLNDPDEINQPAETLLMEATYGVRTHHPVEEVYGELIAVVAEAVATGGKIVVPAFSLGRTQELIYLLHRLTDEGQIPRIPIVVDSPLAGRINEVFMHHQAEYNAATARDFPRPGDTPLAFTNLRFTHTVEESKALNSESGPMMIISASGMASGGRVTHHLKNCLPNPNNIVLITGYQADHTPGRRLVSGYKTLRLFGQDVPVRAKIQIINDLSAHADSTELLAYPASISGLKRIVVVHSEADRANAFAALLKQRYPQLEIILPQPNVPIALT